MLLDIAATAEQLGVKERTVRELVAKRRIPFVRVGRLIRFDPADLENFKAANRVEAVR